MIETLSDLTTEEQLQFYKSFYNLAQTIAQAKTAPPIFSEFSHIRIGRDTEFKTEGLRDFFKYCDLGIAAATGGRLLVQLVRANRAPEEGTGWHLHEADFHVVYMTRGWARFMYEDQDTLVQAGDCIHQKPGIRHFLYDYSEDMEFLEIISPADFPSIPVEAPEGATVPAPKPWYIVG